MVQTKTKRFYFEEGNTVRRMAIPEEEWKKKKERERKERIRRRRAIEIHNAAVLHQNKVSTMALIAAVAVLSMFFVSYVRLQNDINTSMRNIANLEETITELKSQNQAAENRINSAANLEMVKDAAVNRLGMVYANADQIVYYTVEETDYMSQYADIP